MISANFYPTNWTYSDPSREITNNILDVGLSNAYWLGWMKWENVPDCWKLSEYSISGTAMTLTNATPAQNVNVGYTTTRGASAGRRWTDLYYDNNSTMFPGYPAQYINKYDIMGSGPGKQLEVVTLFSYAIGTTDALGSFYSTTNILSSVDADVFYKFLKGEGTYDFTQGLTNVGSLNWSLNIEDLNDNNTWSFSGQQNGYYYAGVVCIISVTVQVSSNVSTNGTWLIANNSTNITPVIGFNTNEINYSQISASTIVTSTQGQIRPYINNGAFTASTLVNGLMVGGFVGTMPATFFGQPVNAYFIPADGNFIFTNTGSAVQPKGYLSRILSINEILKVISLMPRYGSAFNGTDLKNYGYTKDIIWATHVTDDNEFLAELITGDLNDPDFISQLRPWQYDVDEWSENDYTIDDLPPYEPGGDDDPSSIGDDFLPYLNYTATSANGFITQYCLTDSQLQGLGAALWSGINDAAFVQSVMVSLTNDYSIDPAHVLNYIVSLRKYPFTLDNIAGYVGTGNGDVYMGRGLVPITISQTGIGIMQNMSVAFGGSYAYIPRKYNDFRDYEPYTQITITIPFCGNIAVKPSQVMGHTLFITYVADFATGNLQAFLWVQAETAYIIGSINGQCAANIQLTSTNEMDFLQKIGGGLLTVGTAAVTAGASLGAETAMQATSAVASATAAGESQPNKILQNSGFGMFAQTDACAHIVYNNYAVPAGYGHSEGFACNFRSRLGDLSGYTVCANVDTTGITANSREREEIKRLLESGIFV